jgi:hypothetical protein
VVKTEKASHIGCVDQGGDGSVFGSEGWPKVMSRLEAELNRSIVLREIEIEIEIESDWRQIKSHGIERSIFPSISFKN